MSKDFQSWLKSNGFRNEAGLTIHCFEDTGRGLMSRNGVNAGGQLVAVPSNLIISRQCCLDLFPHKTIESLSDHQAIALFIALQKSCTGSFWKPFIDVLPSDFDTLPYFYPPGLLEMLPDDIAATVALQRQAIRRDYSRCLEETTEISLDVFEWAWFVVNTRCISLNPSVKPSNASISKEFVLVPFLDFFNHSQDVSIDAVFDVVKREYVIHIHQQVEPGAQAFIRYGPHDNNFLLSEYGFVHQGNGFNFVSLDHEFNSLFGSVGAYSHAVSVLTSRGLWGEFVLTLDCLGYRLMNALRLLVAAGSIDKILAKWDRVVMGATPYIDAVLEKHALELLRSLVCKKLDAFQQSSALLQNPKTLVELFSKQVICESIEILEASIGHIDSQLNTLL